MDNNELLAQISEALEVHTRRIEAQIEAHTRRIEVKIENEVTKRIDSLFDGYKITHEKQGELEGKNETLKTQLDDLQTRVTALEERTA